MKLVSWIDSLHLSYVSSPQIFYTCKGYCQQDFIFVHETIKVIFNPMKHLIFDSPQHLITPITSWLDASSTSVFTIYIQDTNPTVPIKHRHCGIYHTCFLNIAAELFLYSLKPLSWNEVNVWHLSTICLDVRQMSASNTELFNNKIKQHQHEGLKCEKRFWWPSDEFIPH